MKVVIYTDGASRGNPGPASYGFTISDQTGKLVYQEGKYIGKTTNNVAEYTGVWQAVKYVKEKLGRVKEIELFADSLLVASQLSGKFKIKNAKLKPLFGRIKILEMEIGRVFYSYIPRSRNFQADKLANEALDKKFKVTS